MQNSSKMLILLWWRLKNEIKYFVRSIPTYVQIQWNRKHAHILYWLKVEREADTEKGSAILMDFSLRRLCVCMNVQVFNGTIDRTVWAHHGNCDRPIESENWPRRWNKSKATYYGTGDTPNFTWCELPGPAKSTYNTSSDVPQRPPKKPTTSWERKSQCFMCWLVRPWLCA